MLNTCLIKNEYFKAKVAYINDGVVYIVISRLDTFEHYVSFSIYNNTDKKTWILEADKIIKKLDVPIDWKKPHRYCLAYYARQVLNDDDFTDKLNYNLLSDSDIYRYVLISRLKETALIKKLNQLPKEEKIQLFILKDWEIEASVSEDIHYAIYGRQYIYKRLYDKKKYTIYYKKYLEKIENVFGKIDENE